MEWFLLLRWEYAEVVELAYTTDLSSVSLWVRVPSSVPAARQMDIGSVHDKDVRPKRVVISTKLPSPQFGSVAQLVEQQTKKERYNLSYSKVFKYYNPNLCVVRSIRTAPTNHTAHSNIKHQTVNLNRFAVFKMNHARVME